MVFLNKRLIWASAVCSNVTTFEYKRLNPFDKRLTYIWDETESMNDLIREWIPNRLLDILKQKKVKGSMKDIEELISDWVMKIVNS